MKVRQDKIKIRHRAAAPDKVRIITGPVDLTLERAHEPHELERPVWAAVFSDADRALFDVVEDPVVVPDLSEQAGRAGRVQRGPAVGGSGGASEESKSRKRER